MAIKCEVFVDEIKDLSKPDMHKLFKIMERVLVSLSERLDEVTLEVRELQEEKDKLEIVLYALKEAGGG